MVRRRSPLLKLRLRALRLLFELGTLLNSALCRLYRLHRLVHSVGQRDRIRVERADHELSGGLGRLERGHDVAKDAVGQHFGL